MTGVVVAFGAMFLLTALIGGVLAALGVLNTELSGNAIEAGIGAGIAIVIAQFFSYLWGGYTAGRMSRGAGIGNGLLVPLVALLLGILIVGVATALGAKANLNIPFTSTRFATTEEFLVDWGLTIGIASVAAMFGGGLVGGALGSRWHTRLERRTLEEAETVEPATVQERPRTIDVRDGATTVPPPPPQPVGATSAPQEGTAGRRTTSM